jgi:hypothetical protein
MGRHTPKTSSQAVARNRELRAIDAQISRLWRSYRDDNQAATFAALDDLLDRRSDLTRTLGELLSSEDRASNSEWGELGT